MRHALDVLGRQFADLSDARACDEHRKAHLVADELKVWPKPLLQGDLYQIGITSGADPPLTSCYMCPRGDTLHAHTAVEFHG
jgi:hypothetical protein